MRCSKNIRKVVKALEISNERKEFPFGGGVFG